MNRLSIFYGAGVLAYKLIKSIFYKNTLIYRCPKCNLCIGKDLAKCYRCGQELDWSN